MEENRPSPRKERGMLEWIKLNIGTIAVALILAAAVALIIRKMVRDKKSGKSCSSCGCSCEGCHGCEFPRDVKVTKP